MQMSLTDSDNISKKFQKSQLAPEFVTKFVRGEFGPIKNFDLWRFRCNSFWLVGVLENGNYCILFIVFLSFQSCMYPNNFKCHGTIFAFFLIQKRTTFCSKLSNPRTFLPYDAAYCGLRFHGWYCSPALHELCQPLHGPVGRHNKCCAG